MVIPRHCSSSRHLTPPSGTDITSSLPYRHAPTGSHKSFIPVGPTSTQWSSANFPVPCQLPSRFGQKSPGAQNHVTPYSSEDELSDNFEDSDSDSDDESCCGDRPDAEDMVLPKDDKFQQTVQPLLDLSLKRVREFMGIAQYTAPLDIQEEPPPKRSRLSNWQPGPLSPSIQSDQEHGDDDFVVVSPPKGSFHFSCPFYASNPKQHQQCLKRHDLATIDSVITHVRRHHMRPPYCPICSQVFDTASQCDNHILKRTCELRELVLPEGINYYQKARLVRDDKPHLNNKRRWNCLNTTIFPDKGPISSPYLSRGLGLRVSMARDYWREHGRTVVSDFLEKEVMPDEGGQGEESMQEALCNLALENVLSEVMKEYDCA